MQINIYDLFGAPDYEGSRDEIVRYSIETRFTNSINLIRCCNVDPQELFRSSTEFFVRCKQCGKQTKTFKHLYEAKQAWNRGEVIEK